MKLKYTFISALSALAIFTVSATNVEAITSVQDAESAYVVESDCKYDNPNYCGNNALTNGLESNQITLFYMYSNKEGHFFLDPLAESENVIFVGHNDFPKATKKLHHGMRFVGTFTDTSLWELEGLQVVFYE